MPVAAECVLDRRECAEHLPERIDRNPPPGTLAARENALFPQQLQRLADRDATDPVGPAQFRLGLDRARRVVTGTDAAPDRISHLPIPQSFCHRFVL